MPPGPTAPVQTYVSSVPPRKVSDGHRSTASKVDACRKPRCAAKLVKHRPAILTQPETTYHWRNAGTRYTAAGNDPHGSIDFVQSRVRAVGESRRPRVVGPRRTQALAIQLRSPVARDNARMDGVG